MTMALKTVPMKYLKNERCPLCGAQGVELGRLDRGAYRFGRLLVEYPPRGYVTLERCVSCGLVFKDQVPVLSELLGLFRERAPRVWNLKPGRYANEAALILEFAGPSDSLDVLDVGGGDGARFDALPNLHGRKSVLDPIDYSGRTARDVDEFMCGFAEDDVSWSENPYDVVCAFDLLEHLHNPRKALDNVARFLKDGGLFVVHTGDASCLPQRDVRISEWWYINLFEHHIAWTGDGLMNEMARRGFSRVFFGTVRHRGWAYAPFWKRQTAMLLKALQDVAVARLAIEKILSLDIRQLSDPRIADHITAVFRKNVGGAGVGR